MNNNSTAYNYKGPHPLPVHMWWAWVMAGEPGKAADNFSKFITQWTANPALATPPPPNFNNESFAEFIEGLRIYQESTYERPETKASIVWEQGTTKIYDFGKHTDPIVLVIPSLVNQAHILDVTKDRSLVQYLANQNLRPLLVDWSHPGETELSFFIDDYMARLQEFTASIDAPISVIGYCMGGIFACALASQNPKVKSLTLMATPWDFHASREWYEVLLQTSTPAIEMIINLNRKLPSDIIQVMFSMMNPLNVVRKFQDLAKNPDPGELFYAVEHWLNDCVPLVPEVARQCIFSWYRDNLTLKKQFSINAKVLDPSEIQIPTLAIIPRRDYIVPPASALPLAKEIQNCKIIEPDLGHVGMITSRTAKEEVWKEISDHIALTMS